ncbi:hypothetical protein [Paludisphaera mucosa]|uniref:Uncharacterized protein n=1 Tax=Paludisphaera mucosa TaxID=3030827 RepID=A0ABT6F4J3_9BACT|nr:hypothetical protein [Paludisphaera mucosa]MDG3002491.1 hypothetical protein [Paludisphaera mucosa]
MRPRSGLVLVATLLLAATPRSDAWQDDAPLGLGDLAAEHAALAGKTGDSSPPRPATFRTLWDRPDEFRGKRVRVAGRVVRVFRQDAVGSFPALAEAWIEEPSGDLLCILFPAPERGEAVARGTPASFTGVYLRRVRYQAGGDRLAPLIVGPAAPSVETPSTRVEAASEESRLPDWPGPIATVGLFVGLAAVSGLLAWRSLAAPVGRDARRGRRRGRPAPPGPAPEFLEPEADDGDRA